MRKIRISIAVVFLSMLFSHMSMANSFTDEDLAYAFNSAPESIKIDLLTDQEMEATEGDVFWFPVMYYAFYAGYYSTRAIYAYNWAATGMWAGYAYGNNNNWW